MSTFEIIDNTGYTVYAEDKDRKILIKDDERLEKMNLYEYEVFKEAEKEFEAFKRLGTTTGNIGIDMAELDESDETVNTVWYKLDENDVPSLR